MFALQIALIGTGSWLLARYLLPAAVAYPLQVLGYLSPDRRRARFERRAARLRNRHLEQ